MLSNLAIHVSKFGQPGGRFISGLQGSLLQTIPLRIIGRDVGARFGLSLAVTAPHGGNQGNSIDTTAGLQIVLGNRYGKFGLIASTTEADTGDTIHDSRVGKALGNERPIFRQRNIWHRTYSWNDFRILQRVKEWSNNGMFKRLMDVFNIEKCRWIAQRCVTSIQDANLFEFVRTYILNKGDAVQELQLRSSLRKRVLQHPLREGLAENGPRIFVAVLLLDVLAILIRCAWRNSIDHIVWAGDIVFDPLRQIGIDLRGYAKKHAADNIAIMR
mmetsp:Transcript_30062/g.70413  ORF Transcript_30062/g.70413 Transcript_30062/m.70413 type:complete len:272 (+) Transcript_30062:921-1736(+)